ncbi:hypothetical protein [Bacillus subtilis]|uniref:hypothetical protein n=1 Tax=Bacillus subtilis TaxID=1423 RepID=UPI0013152591|nr:hypothetical protein [Bacillus subtilis]
MSLNDMKNPKDMVNGELLEAYSSFAYSSFNRLPFKNDRRTKLFGAAASRNTGTYG